jgi:hypothetical protein
MARSSDVLGWPIGMPVTLSLERAAPTITASGASSKGRQHEAAPEKLDADCSRLEAAQDVPAWAAQDVRVVETSREQQEERVERERQGEEESACSAISRPHPMDHSDAALGRRGARRSLTTLAEPAQRPPRASNLRSHTLG